MSKQRNAVTTTKNAATSNRTTQANWAGVEEEINIALDDDFSDEECAALEEDSEDSDPPSVGMVKF
jgi:hypothetical protein